MVWRPEVCGIVLWLVLDSLVVAVTDFKHVCGDISGAHGTEYEDCCLLVC
jgi:hypothetical protein